MRHVVVRYQVKSERADENVAAVRAVFAELERARPAGLHYATLRGRDGVTFVHIARIETPDNPLLAVTAFQQFAATIKDRCVEPPVSFEADEVGAYRMFETS